MIFVNYCMMVPESIFIMTFFKPLSKELTPTPPPFLLRGPRLFSRRENQFEPETTLHTGSASWGQRIQCLNFIRVLCIRVYSYGVASLISALMVGF